MRRKCGGLTDRVPLPVLLERYPGRRGTRKLRALLESPEPVGFTRNDFEEAFLVLVDARGISRPCMNADLSMRGRFFQVDALWERERVAVELDRRSVHGTKKRFESDRQRDRILAAEGWRILHVTWRALHDERDEVIADLKAALGQGQPTPTRQVGVGDGPASAEWGGGAGERLPFVDGARAFRGLPARREPARPGRRGRLHGRRGRRCLR
jgi:very-short-patch-repair endonuclease